MDESNFSRNSLFEGRLICYQPKSGYRFSIDAVLLAHFLKVKTADQILDIGCGCGIIGLILAYRHNRIVQAITGLEIQAELAELSRRNSRVNGYDHIINTITGDLNEISTLIQAESYSSVVCNPPFYKHSSGRKNINRQQQIARHQVLADIDSIIACAAFAVQNQGNLSIIYPAKFMTELLGSMVKHRFQPKRVRFIYSYPSPNQQASLMLIEARKNGGSEMAVLEPLYIYESKEGEYTKEVNRFYQPQEQ